MDIDNQTRLCNQLVNNYVVRDDDSNPGKCVYRAHKILDIIVNSEDRIYVVLLVEDTGVKALKSLRFVEDEPIFQSRAEADADAARQQAEEDRMTVSGDEQIAA